MHSEQRGSQGDAERDGRGHRREEHGDGRLPVAEGEAVSEGVERVLRRELPRVVEDEDVVGTDAHEDEQREDLEQAEVAVVEHDAVDEISAEEAGRYAEHCPAGHPEGSGLDEQDEGDEDDTPREEKQVHDRVLLDSVVKQRLTSVEEVHLAYAFVKVLLEV